MNDSGRVSLEECALSLSKRLAESHEAYSSLLDLEQHQQTLIEAGEIEGTASLIADKQALLSNLQTSDERLQRENKAWQEVRDQATAPLRERLQQQVDDLQAVISQILELQKRNEEALREHGDAINQKLQEIQKQRAAHRGYQHNAAKDAYARSRFYDKSS